MKKAIQMATTLWLRLAAMFKMVFGPVARFGRACAAKVGGGRFRTSARTCEITRAATAGAILFGIAGAGMGASGGISAYGVASTAAGATVAVGWGPYWFVWTILWAVIGAAAGAAVAYGAGVFFRQRGPAMALLVVGALGGIFSGATWGSTVARERVVEVRAQPANAKPIAAGAGAKLSVVNGPVRLTGSVAREMNGLVLAFMLGSGALVGALAARGLSTQARREPAEGFSTEPQRPYTA